MKTALNVSYTFDPAAGTIDLSAIPGFNIKKLYAIINITRNKIIYGVGSTPLGLESIAGSIVNLTFDTAGQNAADVLAIYYDITGLQPSTFAAPVALASDHPAIPIAPNPAMIDLPTQNSPAIAIRNAPEKSFRSNFSKAVVGGIDTTNWDLIKSGPGMTIGQSASNLNIIHGTTPFSETIIRSKKSFSGAFTMKGNFYSPARSGSTDFYLEMVDVIGDNLAYNILSATQISVSIPNTTKWDSGNIGQSMFIGSMSAQAGQPGRYPIAAVNTNAGIQGVDLVFTVSGFTVGSGTCSLFGWNYYQTYYQNNNSVLYAFDCQVNGYNNGYSTVTSLNTSTAGGHIAIMNAENGVAVFGNQIPGTGGRFGVTGDRYNNTPNDEVKLFMQIRAVNRAAAVTSQTVAIGFITVEDYTPQQVSLTSTRPTSPNSPAQVTLTNPTAIRTEGTQSNGAASVPAPTLISGLVATANPTAIANNRHNALRVTSLGDVVNKPYSIPESDWSYAAPSGGIITTTDVTLKAAAGTGVRNYLTGISIKNGPAPAVATEVVIKDGATVIWRDMFIPGEREEFKFASPLKSTANTALNIACITTAAAIYPNAQGYIAP